MFEIVRNQFIKSYLVRRYKTVPRGIEPLTLRLTAARSNLLSYGTHNIILCKCFKYFFFVLNKCQDKEVRKFAGDKLCKKEVLL